MPTGLPLERLLALGAEAGGDPDVFNMAALGIRMAARVNGVSRLHGERGAGDVRAALARSRARGRADHPRHERRPRRDLGRAASSARSTARVSAMATAARTTAGSTSPRSRTRSCSRRVRTPACASSTRCAAGSAGRRASAATTRARAHGWPGVLDPQALTLGFARRVPTYKRLTLLLNERERLTRILTERRAARAAARRGQGASARRATASA